MGIAEILINIVGSGIAKGVLNIWLEDDPLQKEIAKNIVSTTATKTKSLLVKRNIDRQFAELGDGIGKSLNSLVDNIDLGLTKDEKKEVIQGLGVTIKNFNSKPTDVFKTDLDTARIKLKLIENTFIPNGPSISEEFNSQQTQLFDILIDEVSNYMLDIITQLPKFQEKALIEMLNRQTFITIVR